MSLSNQTLFRLQYVNSDKKKSMKMMWCVAQSVLQGYIRMIEIFTFIKTYLFIIQKLVTSILVHITSQTQ